MNLQKKLLVLALSTAFAPAAQAANKYWACANGTWNTTCWSSFSGGGAGASQPGSADFVYLLNSSTSNKTVTYASTSNPTLPGLTINATGLGTMTLAQAKDTLTVYEEKIGTTNGGKGAFIQSGGTHTVTTRLILGDVTGSTGTYTQSGGAITVATLLLGHDNNNATNGNGTGVYNLSGGVLTATSSESVGGYGSGIFNHSGGTNTMNFGISLSIGGSATAGSSGTYILSDTGNLSSSDVYVGSAQGGVSSALFTQNGGTHTSVSLNIGYATVGTGNVNSTYTLNAGSLTSQSVTVGISGTGIFNQNGGTNTVTGSLRLGDGNGGGGTYNLNGGTLTLNLIDRLGFGTSYGAVNIDGGTMQLGTSGDISLDSFRIGNSIGSTGSFTMASVYQNIQSNTEIIGNYGTGTFTQTGGTHTVGGVVGSALTLGANSGSSGTYNLIGGTLNVSGPGGIKNGVGTGTLNLDGGTLNVGNIAVDNFNVGNAAGSAGSYTLVSYKTLTATTEIIGNNGTGTFTQNGGTHTVTDTLTLGANSGSSGTYHLNGGVLNVGSIVNGAGNNTFNLGSGTLNFTGAGFVNAGLLKGTGTIAGNVSSGGIVAPGNSPGALNITGNYAQLASGSLNVEIGGLIAGTEYDALYVSGTVNLDGALNVSLFDLGSGVFAPNAGDSFDILTADALQGNFSILNYGTLQDPNLVWHIDYLVDAIGTTDVVRLSVQAVPEAEIYAMMLAGLGLVGWAARRRKQAEA